MKFEELQQQLKEEREKKQKILKKHQNLHYYGKMKEQMKYCHDCNQNVYPYYWQIHLKTNKHTLNALKKAEEK
jgi:hypothetical protein